MSKLQDRRLPQPPVRFEFMAWSQWARELTSSISNFIQDVLNLHNAGKQSVLQLDELTNEPSNPVDGLVVYADGTSWNPGSGEGFYGRQAGAWVKL